MSFSEYQTTIEFQELINKRVEQEITLQKGSISEQENLSDHIIIWDFIFVFVIVGSFYRIHLKEILKQEHYLTSFHRIRVAGNSSTTKFDDEVKTSLTLFVFNNAKNEKISNLLPGRLSSDLIITLINKIFYKLEFKEKKE